MTHPALTLVTNELLLRLWNLVAEMTQEGDEG